MSTRSSEQDHPADTGLRPRRRSGTGEAFHPHSWFDRVFELAIVAKGLNGSAELVGGLLLLTVTPDKIHRLVVALTQGELSEDPHDLLARHLLHTSNGLTGSAVTFGAAYLLLHGLVKVVLVVALLRNKLWAYPWMIAVLLTFVLTWREWRLQRRRRDSTGLTSASDRHCGGSDATGALATAEENA
jgi:uncharacterized membrane protein